MIIRNNSIGYGTEWNDKVEISTKVFRGSRPGEEAPGLEQQRRHTRTTNSHTAFLASFNNTQGDKWGGDGNQQLVLWGLYMVGEEETGTVCIAKTKHMAGSLVWSGLYGFWTFFSLFLVSSHWIASCSLFHHH